MDRWLWSFHSLNDKKIDKILNDAKGIIRIKPTSQKESFGETTLIEHNSQAHKKLIAAHDRFLNKLKYYKDYYVVLVHHVSYDEIEKYDYFYLFAKSFGGSRLISDFLPSSCTDHDGCPHTIYPQGISIFKPPKTKYHICYVDRVIISKEALKIFLQEHLTGFDYKPLAITKEQKSEFEKLSNGEQKNVDSDWWELIAEESETVCVYNGPSDICPKCNGWLGVNPEYIVSVPASPNSKLRVPNKWSLHFPFETFDDKDIQNPKWITVNDEKHKIVHADSRVPIVSRKFLRICEKYSLKGYYKPGNTRLKNDLDVIKHEEDQIHWM
jgi:hypothetical protein